MPLTAALQARRAATQAAQAAPDGPAEKPPARRAVLEASAAALPIRSFEGALSRLRPSLGESGCRDLMVWLAERVAAAATADGMPVYVVTDDPEVARWARDADTAVVTVGRPGLSTAARAAVERLAEDGFKHAVIAHADLARARTLTPAVGPGLTIVPDAVGDGSNVVCVPVDAGFRFAYGPGSFARHVAEANRLGLAVTVVDDPDLAVDIDHPDDLRHLPTECRRALGLGERAASWSVPSPLRP